MNTIGSYKCGCRNGYKFITKVNWELYINEPSCVDIDECSNRGVCPKKSTCQNTNGSFICKCDKGFEGDLCGDIDECTQSSSCDANAECLNMEGSYVCYCNIGYRGNGITCKVGQCEDRRCPPDQQCISPTSDACQCNEGFSYNTVNEFCEDVDECLLDHDCGQNSTCVNIKGSFTCNCNSGFIGDGKTCVEGVCSDETCPTNAECIMPSKPDCRCKNGFESKSSEIEICFDTDECSTLRGICHERAVCRNFPGGYECNCQEGYFGDDEICFRGSCTDINCPPSDHKECVSPRSNDCKCTEGYNFNNLSVCIDIDECQREPCNQNANCENMPGNFSCTCKTGYSGDAASCVDYDECATESHNCQIETFCENTEGSFSCIEKKAVLVLNSKELNKPLLTSAEGQNDAMIIMSFGEETDASQSCSVTYRNKFYVFGGGTKRRQISEVTKCELTRIGTLEFDHYWGTCANMDNQRIYLCFDANNQKQCRSAVNPLGNFTEIVNSTYDHGWTRAAASPSKFIRT